MHKNLIFLALLSLIHLNLLGQNSELDKPQFFDHVRYGGGANIGMGSSYSTFSLSPSVIYDFSKAFSAGFSVTYVYVKNKSTINATTNLYGGSILALYTPINYIQLSSEFENLKINQRLIYGDGIPQWQTALYIGLEYVTGKIAMGLRYDVLYDKTTNIIYSSALSPVFRVYF
ncbi:alpha-ketoglutarate decarboxylase [bacterium AH-315-A23]|nr:alpha-ketoglutarate decarboxylase [bacterium AH-315-A23]PHS54029.1 MAG: alpha-ketoglutarate decarboxylase [Lutibacter sp.]